jgi:hypothetical protein
MDEQIGSKAFFVRLSFSAFSFFGYRSKHSLLKYETKIRYLFELVKFFSIYFLKTEKFSSKKIKN